MVTIPDEAEKLREVIRALEKAVSDLRHVNGQLMDKLRRAGLADDPG